ncbi:MAG TPA: amidohydrolase family protein [Tepidisphaeraceae bacterium]
MEKLDIVDSQIHLFRTMGIEAALACMDSLGIRSAVIDEFWGFAEDGVSPHPCIVLPGGLHRAIAPGGQMASMKHPDRFKYLLRVHHRDPEIAAVIRLSRADPHCVALRVDARTESDVKDFAEHGYRHVFAAATDVGLPVFVLALGNAKLIEPYLAEFPDCRVVIDHIGMPRTIAEYDDVLHLGGHENAMLKWCHAHRTFRETYPFPAAIAGLKRAIAAFGADRILWASDFTAAGSRHHWADYLYYVRDSGEISQEDKGWILSRTARKLLSWPASTI